MSDRTCAVDGCGRAFYARDWCSHHYWEWMEANRPSSLCAADGCESVARVRAFCRKHYSAKLRDGSIQKLSTDPRVRFWTKVDKNGPLPDFKPELGPCWLWIGHRLGSEYGQFTFDGDTWITHRLAYEWCVGPIPDGLQLDHLCRVRPCCNPEHLEPVTRLVNVQRGLSGVLKTHCKHGHEYTPENLLPSGKPRRVCRTCKRALEARRRAAARAAKGVSR